MVSSACDSGPKLTPVSGTVKIDGKPLTTGFIRFIPKKGRPSGGTIDKDGRYEMSSRTKGDGVYEGELAVEVTSHTDKGQTRTWLIPEKYADFTTSGKTITVGGPNENLDIELTWKASGQTGPYKVSLERE